MQDGDKQDDWRVQTHNMSQCVGEMENSSVCQKKHTGGVWRCAEENNNEHWGKQKVRNTERKSHHFLFYREYAGGRVGTIVGVGGGMFECVRHAYVQSWWRWGRKEQDAQPLRNVYSLVARL